jgi:hypothetical protein
MKTLATLMALIAVGVAGCTASAEPPHTNHTYVVWADISRSITPGDLTRWHEVIERRLMPQVVCGDRLVILPIQKDSTASAPLLDWETAALDDEPTRSEMMACRKAQAELKRQVAATFDSLVAAKPVAGWTDIMGTLDRLESLGSQKLTQNAVIAVYLSDMQQASPELNMNKIKLTDEKIAPMMGQLIAKHEKATQAWKGVTVRCWLNPAGPNVAPPLNGQRQLKAFYEELFRQVGGSLVEFQPL